MISWVNDALPKATPLSGASREEQTARFLPQVVGLVALGAILAAVSDIRNDSSAELLLDVPYYSAVGLIPIATYYLYRTRRVSSIALAIGADAALTLCLLLRLAFGLATISGTATFLVLKILAAALLIPWGPAVQLASAGTATLLYWLVLLASGKPIENINWLHQVYAPAIASLISIGGAFITARMRREFARTAENLEAALAQAQRAERDKAGLLEIASAIAGTVDLRPMIARVQARAAAVLDCDGIATAIIDTSSQSFRLIGVHSDIPHLNEQAMNMSFPDLGGVIPRLAKGEVIILKQSDDKGFAGPGSLRDFGVHSLVIAPLRLTNRFFGCFIALRTKSQEDLDPHHIELIEGISGQLALGIEVVDLYRQATEDAATATTLAKVARELIASIGSDSLMQRIADLVREALRCDLVLAYIFEFERESRQSRLAGASGLVEEEWQTLRTLSIPVQEAEFHRTLESGVWQSATPSEPNSITDTFAARFGVSHVLRLPLLRRGQLIGVVTAGLRGQKGPFTEQQLRVAASISQIASLVSENTRLIQELGQANRLQAEFVATMSHELRTPLNIISGYTDLLIDGAFGPLTAAQVDTLQRVTRSSHALTELVSTTLLVNRLDSSQVVLEVSEFEIGQLIAEVVDETKELWDRPGLTLRFGTVGESPRLSSDRGKLKVILKNLIGNAAKFTDHGVIDVRTRVDGGDLVIEVEDTGIGISSESLSIIFERFRQVDTSMTRRFSGVGLGLYIVSRLLQTLGGTIDVRSTVGSGSTFSVRIPFAPAVSRGAMSASRTSNEIGDQSAA